MAFINVAEWTAINTTDWLKGLDDCILPYVQFFLNNNINGCRLLLLSCDDLNHLNVCKVGHQELILDAVDLLKHLHYNFGSETLQSLALRLGCKARSLYNQLKRNQMLTNNNNNQDNSSQSTGDDRVSTQTLSAVSDILAAVKAFISWIDRYPFEGQDNYIPVRKTILKLSIELASTSQRDQFVERPNDVIQTSCFTLSELCDRIVQELRDSLAIQPALLDIVTVKKRADEELGMHIHSSYSGIHIVGGIKFQSPAHRCGRLEEGDEIVQVSYQTVVGWQLKKLVNSMREHPTEIVLTVKKRPRHSNLMGQVLVLKPYKIPARKPRPSSGTGSRLKNASTTTSGGTGGSDADDDAFLPDSIANKSAPGPVYQLYPRKPKLPVRRRATISGSSPTVGAPPIRIEDLVHNMDNSRRKEGFNRSISHDSPAPAVKHLMSRSRGLSATIESPPPTVVTSTPAPTPPVPSTAINSSNNNQNNNSYNKTVNNNNMINAGTGVNCKLPALNTSATQSPKLPYAKVHPFPNADHIIGRNENETQPKKIDDCPKLPVRIVSTENKPDLLPVLKDCHPIPADEELPAYVESKPRITGQTVAPVAHVSPSPVTVMSYKLVSDIQPKSTAFQCVERLVRRSPALQRKAKEALVVNNKIRAPVGDDLPVPNPQPSPTVLRSNSKSASRHSSRRVSCAELGVGECQGWLYQRRDRHRAFLGTQTRWSRRWCVLKANSLYCYKTERELKAECIVHLPAFTIAPAVECKSRKHAFKLYNPSDQCFHFAADSAHEMSAWMQKLGAAAIAGYLQHRDVRDDYSETSDSEESATSPAGSRQALHSRPKPIGSAGSYREQSPTGLSTTSSSTDGNSIRDELYGRSRMASTDSSSTSASNSSTFHESRRPRQPFPSNSMSTGAPSPIPSSPRLQHRQPNPTYQRSASSLEVTDVIAARNRRLPVLLNDSSGGNTRYAKIVFPSAKGSYSPQIPVRRFRIPAPNSAGTYDSGSLDRQRLNFLRDVASGTVSKMTDSYNNLEGNSSQVANGTPATPQPPRPLPRSVNTINRRENVLPGFVAKMADNYDKTAPTPLQVPKTPPTRPAVPKPQRQNTVPMDDHQNTGATDEQTYEYVFRPTMAQIKTGIVNPLYEQVPNNSRQWRSPVGPPGAATPGVQPLGKARMPSPLEIQKPTATDDNEPQNSENAISILDREYNRLYGAKKPNERLSPKGGTGAVTTGLPTSSSPVPYILPKSASSVEIESIYTSKPRTTSSSSSGGQGLDDNCRPITPSTAGSDGSVSSSSGISSYYSTYLEIPAEQMHRMLKNKRQNTSTSSYHSALDSSPTVPLNSSTDSQHKLINSHTKQHSFDFGVKPSDRLKLTVPTSELIATGASDDIQEPKKTPKSPQKSSSFRLFGSPKLLKKLSTPKYQKEKHSERRDVCDKPPQPTPPVTTRTGRLFLGSPKLTRAFFGSTGSSKKTSPPAVDREVAVPTASTPLCDKQSIGSTNSSQTSDDSLRGRYLNRSSSDSSVQSFGAPPGARHKSHHIIERRLNPRAAPQLTIQLPVLTSSSTTGTPNANDSVLSTGSSTTSEQPLTPETPRKPTMGVAMIGKKRRPSQVSSDKSDIECALQQYYSGTGSTPPTGASLTPNPTARVPRSTGGSDYTTGTDTEDEWANIVRTIEVAGRTLNATPTPAESKGADRQLPARCDGNGSNDPIDDDKLCHLVLSLRSLQRTLTPDQHLEFDAINQLLNQPITTGALNHWCRQYPHLLPQDY